MDNVPEPVWRRNDERQSAGGQQSAGLFWVRPFSCQTVWEARTASGQPARDADSGLNTADLFHIGVDGGSYILWFDGDCSSHFRSCSSRDCGSAGPCPIVSISVTMPDGRTQELMAPESGLATLQLKDGTEYAFRPTIHDSSPWNRIV